MKFALISNVLPPSESAHAAIINRLLRDFDPESYCLLSSHDYSASDEPDYTGRLAGKYYYLQPTLRLTRGYRFGVGFARERINLLIGVLQRARRIAHILRSEGCDRVVVCTGGREILDFPAGYIASRLVGARFYAYLLDQYSHMVSYVLGDNSFLQRLESLIMRNAAAVMAPNEFLRDELRRRYKIEAVIIRNACDLSVYDETKQDEEREANDEVSIVYTGGVGLLHFDAFKNLLAAIESIKNQKVKLHLYTSQPQAECEREGITGPVVYHRHEAVSAMPRIQQQADILFLPLAFRSPYPEIVRTAAPGKIGEYLAAGRPILVHAPKDSFVAWYFREHECGVVVDEDNPAQLARSLEQVLSDEALREKLCARARLRARADFDHLKAREQFAELLGLSANYAANSRGASAQG